MKLTSSLVVLLIFGTTTVATASAQPAPTQPAPAGPAFGVPATPFGAAEAEPATGIGKIIGGWILTAFAAVNLASLPLVRTDWYRDSLKRGYRLSDSEADSTVRVLTYITLAQILLEGGIGVPLLVSGYGDKGRHQEWEQRHAQPGPPVFFYAPQSDGRQSYHTLQLAWAW